MALLAACNMLVHCTGHKGNLDTDLLATENKSIIQAISLRNNGRYKEALELFQSAQSAGIPESEREYSLQNMHLCAVLAGVAVPLEIYSNRKDIIPTLTRAIVALHRQEPLFESLHQVKSRLSSAGLSASFLNLMTNEQLGLAHQLAGLHMDSALHYFSQARQNIDLNPTLVSHTPRILYHLAGLTLVNRDQISGLAYVDEALSHPMDIQMKAKLRITQGTILRKLGRFNASDSIYHLASESISDVDTTLRLLLLRERALHAIMVKDSSAFAARMNAISTLATGDPDREAQQNRLWGYYYLNKGNSLASIRHYTWALAQFQKQKYPETVLLMEALYILTQQHQALKQYGPAEEAAYMALTTQTAIQGKPYTWENTLHPAAMNRLYSFINFDLLANVYLTRYKDSDLQDDTHLMKATRLYEVIDSLMWTQVRVAEENAVLRFLEVGDKIYAAAVEACYLAFQRFGDAVYMEKAHHYMERDKALILYGDILLHDQNYFPDIPREFKKRELAIKRRIAALKNEGMMESKNLALAIKDLDNHYHTMKLEYPAYYAAKFQQEIPDFGFYQEKAHGEDKSIIQYLMGREHLYILNYSIPGQFIQVRGAQSLQEEVFSLRSLISTPPLPGDSSVTGKFYRLSHSLHQQLVAPLAGLKKNLLLVPDGVLNDLPFEVLSGNRASVLSDGDFLVKEHDMAYAHSLKTTRFANATSKKGFRHVLAFAYSDPADPGLKTQWPFLKGSITELKQISTHFGEGATLRFGKDASKKFFLSSIEKPYDVVHVALHAASSHNDKLENKIYFPGEAGKDEVVYGYELVPRNCAADLVMITGCESGFGPNVSGEGTYSLARAFLQGGANNVVGSLWGLPDFSSAQLTGGFYQSLKSGSAPSAALAQAKRDYLRMADNNTAQPFYWAGLVVYGD